MSDLLLTLNTGSSSIKAAVYNAESPGRPLEHIVVDRIGEGSPHLLVSGPDGAVLAESSLPDQGFEAALRETIRRAEGVTAGPPRAIGHRVVHGGPRFTRAQLVTADLLDELRRLVPVDPQHLPQAIGAMETAAGLFPWATHVACFDTAFHRTMPQVSQLYGLPYHLAEEGVVRYGFHGLSYESIVSQLRNMGELPPRLIVAHLGNGSSMTAIREGRSVDTTMGFSPTSGLLMGTRSGDLDPSVLLYLQRAHGMNADAMSRLVNKDSGLLGVSGESSDMRDLLALEATRPRAALAVDMYCYVARKFMAALIAALAGVDLVVFTGGIGEYGAAIRRRICSGLGFLGIELDDERNDANAPVVSKASRVTVRVMRTDEDSMIARHTAWVLKEKDGNHVHI